MDKNPLATLHMHGGQSNCESDTDDSCSSSVYVSNEESALIQTLLKIRKDAEALRIELKTAPENQRQELQSKLTDLRAEWKRLSARRDRAGTRKMAMLGHIPWHEAEWND